MGEGGYALPTIQIHFSAEPHDRGGSKYTQTLSFVITEHLKLVLCQKKILQRVRSHHILESS